MKLDDLPRLPVGEHLSGDRRQSVRDDLAEVYDAGASIRDFGARIGRSYSTVHHLLWEAGVKFRRRGNGAEKE